MTTANKITLARIFMIPLFVMMAVYYGRSVARGQPLEWQRITAILIFIAAAASDGVDGYIARHYNQRSKLGEILDPIADKGLLLNLGLAYMKQESYAAARPVFQTLVKVAPGNLQARELLATSDLYTGRVSEAVRSFETLRTEEPQNAGLLYLLGVGYLKQQQAEKAREALDAFLLSAPPAQASFVLCRAYYESTLFDEAAAQCRAAMKIDPNFAGAHRELGKVLLSQRSLDASKELMAAIDQDPNDSEALYFLGGALLQEDRIAEAEPYLERALKLKPSFWGNYYYLGKAKFQQNQAAKAVPLLEKAAALNSSESAVFYQLGRALKAVGRTADANRAMQRVQELKTIQK